MVKNVRHKDTASSVVEQRGDFFAHVLLQAVHDMSQELFASNLRILLARIRLVSSTESLDVVFQEESAITRRHQVRDDFTAVLVVEQLFH